MQKTAYIIRHIKLSDVENVLKLSAAEDWNQTEKDWKFLIENPANICMLTACDDKIIGTTTAINYANKLAWIGMVLVDKGLRGQGVSKAMLTKVFEKLNSFESIKLDATAAGQLVYKKFEFEDEYTIDRMTASSIKNIPDGNDDNTNIELVRQKHLPDIIALDEKLFGINRNELINYLASEYSENAWVVKQNNAITGFALGRAGSKYYQIGPMVAANINDAKILIKKVLKGLANQPVVIDILNDKVDLLTWLRAIGFVKQRQFIRMYKKENPYPGKTSNLFLIAGPEFG